MAADMRFIDLRNEATPDLVATIYHELLEPAFGADELDSLDVVRDGLNSEGSYEAWGVCALVDEQPIGCVLAYPFHKSGVVLLGYIAVAPTGRDRGTGGILITEAKRRWLGKSDVTLMLGEIEDPRRYGVQGDIDPKRRAAFYARLGVQVIVGPYFQPRLAPDKDRVHNLFLSVLGDADTDTDSVAGDQIADFLIEYFRDSGEGDDWPREHDDEGRKLLAWYRERDRVPMHPISDYSHIEIPLLSRTAPRGVPLAD